MDNQTLFWLLITVFVLACFVGYYVVWGVTPALHSSLMSVANAVSGIIVVGAIIVAGHAQDTFTKFLGLFAIMMASVNIFGGFGISHRMLLMFKKKDRK